VQQLAAEADDRGVGLVDVGERAVGAYDVDDPWRSRCLGLVAGFAGRDV